MRFPSLSDLEPEQIRAIGEAKMHGHGSFEKNGVIYTLQKKKDVEWFAITACERCSGANVGYISTGYQGQHYSVEVIPEFRGLGIGTLLLRTKEAMDGILSHDWSARYSRILFLIQRGYIPVRKVGKFEEIQDDKRISRDEWKTLILALQNHVHKHLTGDSKDDFSPTVYRMKYSPGKARELVKKHQLGQI